MEPNGSFFISKPKLAMEDLIDPDTLMHSDAEYYRERFEGIKALREGDDGTMHRGNEFRRVASFVNVPAFMAVKLQDPELLKDKKKFYAFLDRHPEYLTYQRRNQGRMTAKDELKLPLSVLGLDYPGAPETLADWDETEIPLAEHGEMSTGPVVDDSPEAV